MIHPTYLKRRKLGWYVQLPVPRSQQHALGCKVLTRSLQTRDEGEALRRRHRVIAELQALLTETPKAPPAETPEAILQRAQSARAAVDAGKADPLDEELALDATVDDFLSKQARKVGVDKHGHPRIPDADVSTIQKAKRALTGNPALTLGYQAERYMAQVERSDLRRQTVGDKERHLEAFLQWIGRDTEAKRVTKSRAVSYVDEALTARDVSQQTKRTALNTVRQFFDWMEVRDVVTFNPFDKAGALLKDSKRAKKQARRPWTPEELLKVLQYVPQDDPLWALAALGAYTGARREDLCALRVESASEDVLVIHEGKTEAAARRVPVHPVIKPLVRRLLKISTDGFLLPGLLASGVDGKRGVYIGKRFLDAKTKAGVTDSRVVFHSFRNSVLTQMEAAGVELSLRQQIVGHERGTVTERVYTAEAADHRRAKAIAHVTYGKTVDKLVRSAGASLSISKVSARRTLGAS
jgi:integrase